MPWKITGSGNSCYVTNENTGKHKNKKGMSRARAKAYLKALYSNVPEARKK